MHMPPDNKDIWMPNSVSMAVWRRMTGVKSTCKKPACLSIYCVHKDTQACKCVGVHVWGRAGMAGWIGMVRCDLQAACLCMGGNQKVHSAEGLNLFLLISLHLSHTSTCRERGRQLFVCVFCLKSSPAPRIYSSWPFSLKRNSRLMFLQLFRHRHFVAMSQSSTRHSAVLIHIQAPHSML